MYSIKPSNVRCKICGFTTTDSNAESRHVVDETIKFGKFSIKTGQILKIIHEAFNVNINDAESVFSEIMEVMDEDSKFKLLDCMEIVND